MLALLHRVTLDPRKAALSLSKRTRARIYRRRQFFRPLLEQLEDRRLLATITVTGYGGHHCRRWTGDPPRGDHFGEQ